MTYSAFDATATVYHRAFKQMDPVFPYFAAEQSGDRG